MNKKNVFILLSVQICLLFSSGCGSDLKLRVNTAEEIRHTPAADLTRRVEVTYRDANGLEKYREGVAVTGLGQPIDLNSDAVKSIEWNKDGRWEAKALDGDGGLLLFGAAQADPGDTDVVEVTISRAAALSQRGRMKEAASSVILKFVRPYGFGTSEKVPAAVIREKKEKGECYDLPTLDIKFGATGEYFAPGIFFETSVRGGDVKFSLAKDAPTKLMPIAPSGDAFLELSSLVNNSVQSSPSGTLELHLSTDENEGCVRVPYKVSSLIPPTLIMQPNPYRVSGGIGKPNIAAFITLVNDNPFAVNGAINCFLDEAPSQKLIYVGAINRPRFESYYNECDSYPAQKNFERQQRVGPRSSFFMPVCGYVANPPGGGVRLDGFKLVCRAMISGGDGLHAESAEKTYFF